MTQIGHRRRTQPRPPHIVLAELRAAADIRVPAPGWLRLMHDERRPAAAGRADDGREHGADELTWTGLWTAHPDANVRLLVTGHGSGSAIEWWLTAPGSPDQAVIGHLRRRVNELLERDLRGWFGRQLRTAASVTVIAAPRRSVAEAQ